jgi:hypothetical protein
LPEDEGVGFWLGLTYNPVFTAIVMFIYGVTTGIVALCLGFGKLPKRIPDFDYSYYSRKTPSG